MAYTYTAPPEFKRVLAKKPPKTRANFLRALKRMEENPRHPSLRTRKLKGRGDMWYARASRGDRITFYISGSHLDLVMNCGHEIL